MQDRMTVPVIRLEIAGMKQAVAVALTQYAARMDADIQAAVDRVCTTEHITRLIDDVVRQEIDAGVKSALHSYFAYGDGHKEIEKIVAGTLKRVK